MTVIDDDGHTETQVISLTVDAVNDTGAFTGNTSATGSEDDATITARSPLLMPSTVTLLPTTRSRQSRTAVPHLSMLSPERGRTRQTLTLAALILFV